MKGRLGACVEQGYLKWNCEGGVKGKKRGDSRRFKEEGDLLVQVSVINPVLPARRLPWGWVDSYSSNSIVRRGGLDEPFELCKIGESQIL